MQYALSDPRPVVLSAFPARRGQRRLALAVVGLSTAIFAAAAPFAKVPLAPVWAFIPVYESAIVINDLITAVLLLGQFNILRSPALLVLAGGYLFTAFIAVAHALTFPGLFAPGGLLGAGPQSTAWLYMFWHGGFPLAVTAYALLGNAPAAPAPARTHGGLVVLATVFAVLAAVGGFTFAATAGHALLPAIMDGQHYTPAMLGVVSGVWVLSLIALACLWWRRQWSILDLWLMVVMCAWLFDIALSAVLNAGRFDLGFYAGRIYGLLAASFVLMGLLLENGMLHARLAQEHQRERERSAEALARHEERLRVLHEIDRAILAVKPAQSIAEAAIQPLRRMLHVPRAIVNIFDLEAGEVEWLAAAGRRRTHVGPGVRYSIRLMGDVDALKRGVPQIIDTHALPPGPEVDALLASGVHVYMVMPMIAGGELIGAISFGGSERAFPAEQVAIAREVAAQIAIAITHARLLERVKRHAEELELRVRERTSELQAANRELESFSYSVSHDLRVPLRAIDGYSQMLEEDYARALDDEGRRLLGVIRENSQRMGALIDDLLAFSRLGRKPITASGIDMNSLVAEVLRELRPAAATNGLKTTIADLPPASGDRTLLKQVWVNLLSNAIKFSGRNAQPVIEVDGNSNGTENVYRVRDNGAGFDMQYYGKLFGVFQRLHGQDEYPGTGVGLAIVQRVVARHGGRVWAEGKINAGATFYFALPKGNGDGRHAAS